MKKLFTVLLATAALCLTGCGNQELGWGNYNFCYVHVQMHEMTKPVHLHVKSWKNDDGGIELKVTVDEKEAYILLGDGTYMMYNTSECPICGQVEYK